MLSKIPLGLLHFLMMVFLLVLFKASMKLGKDNTSVTFNSVVQKMVSVPD